MPGKPIRPGPGRTPSPPSRDRAASENRKRPVSRRSPRRVLPKGQAQSQTEGGNLDIAIERSRAVGDPVSIAVINHKADNVGGSLLTGLLVVGNQQPEPATHRGRA